ncbi:MAG: 8-amino-7-oxononanoate synthase [Cyclobacteriaceae bacterium]|jgi:8-amino-7-oxononanoate synthase
MNESFLKNKIEERQLGGNLRHLPSATGLIDFVSNDYLGLSQNQSLAQQIAERINSEGFISNGGTGSRLLSGNHKYYELLENYLKTIFCAEAVLIFNSGYAANQALVSAVAEKGDTIIYDQLSHVCLKEGAWLSSAQTVAFRHNDLDDLKMKIQQAQGRVFVVTETIFSMDGDVAPLQDIVGICEEKGAYLIIDEAHSTGAMGQFGAGMLVHQQLEKHVFARVYTFGKAMGVHGACVAGSQVLKDFLVNFGRPFIYTTSLPPHSVIAIEESFKYLTENIHLQEKLEYKIQLFRDSFPESISNTAIQPVLIGSNEKAREVSSQLQREGFDVRPILSPTVQRGTERLRISLHVHNFDDEIRNLSSRLIDILA